jgi:hypothetical protein
VANVGEHLRDPSGPTSTAVPGNGFHGEPFGLGPRSPELVGPEALEAR